MYPIYVKLLNYEQIDKSLKLIGISQNILTLKLFYQSKNVNFYIVVGK